ncbi:MAG: holin family protein [Planktomarina sp.]
MGIIGQALKILFGGGRNAAAEVAGIFRENAESRAVRAADAQRFATQQFAAEFMVPRKGGFDRFMDGVNRIPRPAMALGTLALFVAAMVDPLWFSDRMAGLALVPDPLWWLLGAIVSFYFGARFQTKGQEFRRSLQTQARSPQIPVETDVSPDHAASTDNAAIEDWHRWRANGAG